MVHKLIDLVFRQVKKEFLPPGMNYINLYNLQRININHRIRSIKNFNKIQKQRFNYRLNPKIH